MRQWHIDPGLLCRKHLLGEHVEHHMFVGALRKGKSIEGYIRDGLVEVHTLIDRHDEVAKEMIARGYNHKSPLDDAYNLLFVAGRVDPNISIHDLKNRCPNCLKRIKKSRPASI